MTTAQQLRFVMKRDALLALPARKKCGQNGLGLPLWSWMRGAKACEKSRIFAVCEGRAKYAFSTYRESIELQAERLCEKYRLTSVQHHLLMAYLAPKMRGWAKDPILRPGMYDSDVILARHDHHAYRCLELIFKQARKQKLTSLPLRFILNAELTNIILIEQLKGILK